MKDWRQEILGQRHVNGPKEVSTKHIDLCCLTLMPTREEELNTRMIGWLGPWISATPVLAGWALMMEATPNSTDSILPRLI